MVLWIQKREEHSLYNEEAEKRMEKTLQEYWEQKANQPLDEWLNSQVFLFDLPVFFFFLLTFVFFCFFWFLLG